MTATPAPAALLVVDVQQAFAIWDAEGRRRNNPEALERIAELLAAFRAAGLPVIHIRHAGGLASSFRPDGPVTR